MKLFTAEKSAMRDLIARVLLFCLIFSLVPNDISLGQELDRKEYFRPIALRLIRQKPAKQKPFTITEDDVAITVLASEPTLPQKKLEEVYVNASTVAVEKLAISADDVAIEPEKVKAYKIEIPKEKDLEIGPNDVAVEKTIQPQTFVEPQQIKTPPAQVVEYARNFWDEADYQMEKRNISISGTKTFEMKKADVSGDIGHFSTENYDSMPGFHLDQSLHLEIDGNITENSTVHAVLDDKDDEDRRFTVNIDGPVWKFVMGDFPLALEGTEFTLFRKEVRGIMAQGAFHEKFKSIFLFSQSKGQARREQFRGAGQQQEFRLQGSPVVQNSERVSIDGRLLTRGSDYLVDYEDGLLKFLPHILPIEVTRWIVIEYEVSDKSMAFSRNLFGTRHVYTHSRGREIGVSWLREVDDSTPKTENNASGTATPMQHDIVGADINWQIDPRFSVTGETAVSFLDPNKNSEQAPEDRCLTGHASKLALNAKTDNSTGSLTFKRIDKDFKVVGREGGVTELGERGLVNDILSGRARFEYRFVNNFKFFADAEKSETNLADDPTLQRIDFEDKNAGFVWHSDSGTRIEVRGGRQQDQESGPMMRSDVLRDTAAAVWDKKFGKLNTQAKVQNTAYKDSINLASDSSVLEMSLNMGAEADRTFAWNIGASRIAVEDEMSPDDLRSETRNYSLDLNYEPNRVFNARGLFQWRREDDFYANSRMDTEIADSQFRYEPTRDFRTQLKYKVENTSKILRDPTLDPEKYITPPSLPNSEDDSKDIVTTFENPVQKTTANFLTDYRINRYLQAYFDWRRRELIDQATDTTVSTNDRKTYELRYTPLEKMLVTTEYEEGVNRNLTPATELRDYLKAIQLRHEFYEGCFLDATYEERDEDEKYNDVNDTHTKSKILGFQRKFNRWASLELGLQHNIIDAKDPSREWEKRLAVILTPFSRSQRYKFFINHKDITSAQSGTHYEGGLNFSQFIGTDTIIDGEFKKVHSSPGLTGSGYDAVVFNAKMVVTF
jgi:lipoprotein-anchoring transpeptidase ErfK/SrfK